MLSNGWKCFIAKMRHMAKFENSLLKNLKFEIIHEVVLGTCFQNSLFLLYDILPKMLLKIPFWFDLYLKKNSLILRKSDFNGSIIDKSTMGWKCFYQNLLQMDP